MSDEAGALEGFRDSITRSPASQTCQARRKEEVLSNSEEPVYAGFLEYQPQAPPNFPPVPSDVVAKDVCGALAGREEGGQQKQRGGFSGAIRTQKSHDGAGGYLEIKPIERSRGTIPAPQPFRLDGWRRFAHTRCGSAVTYR